MNANNKMNYLKSKIFTLLLSLRKYLSIRQIEKFDFAWLIRESWIIYADYLRWFYIDGN